MIRPDDSIGLALVAHAATAQEAARAASIAKRLSSAPPEEINRVFADIEGTIRDELAAGVNTEKPCST